jgi:thiamine-monophosphate kinase
VDVVGHVGASRYRADVTRPHTLADLGEAGLLRRLFPLLPAGDHTLLGPGDDAAVVAAPDGRVVVTTDVLVEGRDFRGDWSSPEDVGWKAAAQNLADIAAMGAVPTALLVALVAPPGTDVQWALGLSRGLAAACAGTGTGVVGGDLSSGSELVVAVTALGTLEGREPVRRDGARPGDVVAVAGALGRSAAGLALLERGSADVAPELVEAHRRPRPPYGSGPAAALAGATAMIDVSDGLLRDAGRVADASRAGIDVDRALLSSDVDGVTAAATALAADPWAWVLGGGEDHSLLACFPVEEAAPAGYRRIGRVVEGSGVTVDGEEALAAPGWDHFGGR